MPGQLVTVGAQLVTVTMRVLEVVEVVILTELLLLLLLLLVGVVACCGHFWDWSPLRSWVLAGLGWAGLVLPGRLTAAVASFLFFSSLGV